MDAAAAVRILLRRNGLSLKEASPHGSSPAPSRDAAPRPVPGAPAWRGRGCCFRTCSTPERRPTVARRPLPPPIRPAPAEARGDGCADVGERDLAVLGKVEGAGRRLFQRQQVQLGEVVDVHGGPSVQAAADDAHRAMRARLLDQERDLDALRVRSLAHAVDQGRADDHCAHALGGSREHRCIEAHGGPAWRARRRRACPRRRSPPRRCCRGHRRR